MSLRDRMYALVIPPASSERPAPRWLPWGIAAVAVGVAWALRAVWAGDSAERDLGLAAVGLATITLLALISRARRVRGDARTLR